MDKATLRTLRESVRKIDLEEGWSAATRLVPPIMTLRNAVLFLLDELEKSTKN